MNNKTCIDYNDGFVDSSPTGQNVRNFADKIFKCIFMNEKFYILIPFILKFVPEGPIDSRSALV